MKSLSAILAIFVTLLLATGGLAAQHLQDQQDQQTPDQQQDQETQTSYTLVAQVEAGEAFFTLEDEGMGSLQQETPTETETETETETGTPGETPDEQERNPTLQVPPDEEITLTLRIGTGGEQHRLCVDVQEQETGQQTDQETETETETETDQQIGQQQQETPTETETEAETETDGQQQQQQNCTQLLTQEGDEEDLMFTSPSSGSFRYYDDENPQAEGQIQVQEDGFQPEEPGESPEDTPEEEPTPGPALIGLLAVLGFAGLFALRRRQ